MAIDSREHYYTSTGWSVKDVFTLGVRVVVMYIKNNQSLTDPIVVEYSNGQRESVQGEYLYTNINDALDWIQSNRLAEVDEKQDQIVVLEREIDDINRKYGEISIEE